jgi:hypothetical protein
MTSRIPTALLCASFLAPLLFAQDLVRVENNKRYPVPIATEAKFLNPWPAAEEARFMEKAAHLIELWGPQKNSGSTVNEREKDLYPRAMFQILAGKDAEGVAALTQPQRFDPPEHHAYTDGFDFWYGFTLKGAVRKYFHFGQKLPADYRKRFETAFAKWTKTDPRETPHPFYLKYNPKLEGWTPERFGNRQVDGRRTDNLYAMTTVATYLFAEAAGNEATRKATWERIRDYGVTMYMNGIGEWDSENYLSHTMSAYVNLYDFAKDPQVKMHAKGMLDWISMSMAVKYWRGGWTGAVKRDYGNIMALSGNALLAGHLYFDDLGLKCEGDRDDVHHITSAYRPPYAAVQIARNQIALPAELLISHPTYENWKVENGVTGRDRPEFFETLFFGHTFRFGTLVNGNGGDVSGFRMITENAARGVDYFILGHSLAKEQKAMNEGKTVTRSTFGTTSAGAANVAHYRNLAIYAVNNGTADFFILCAPGSIVQNERGIQFLRHAKTWIALTPIGMEWKGRDEKASATFAPAGDILVGKGTGGVHAGFAMEVGEAQSHGTFEQFVQSVLAKSKLIPAGPGVWTFSGVNGSSVGLAYKGSLPGVMAPGTTEEVLAGFPVVQRNGKTHDWREHFAQYRNPATPEAGPVYLGFKEGRMLLQSNNARFEGRMSPDGTYSFSNSAK